MNPMAIGGGTVIAVVACAIATVGKGEGSCDMSVDISIVAKHVYFHYYFRHVHLSGSVMFKSL